MQAILKQRELSGDADRVTPPEIAFERFLYDKHARGEKKYEHISGRVAVEDLPPGHLYRWISEWTNQQLSDIGETSTGGVALPPLHFELVQVDNGIASAHTFETGEWGFIVLTQPMLDEMLRLSRRLVDENRALMTLQIAPMATAEEISHLILLMQFSFVLSHEYSHLVRQHLEDNPPHADAVGEALSQAQELDADGYGIYHELAYFFLGAGRLLASQLLKLTAAKALENSILSCFLLGGMTQFCARWAGKIQVESDLGAEHPPIPLRIQYTILFVDLWCREIGAMSTTWMTDGTLTEYFSAAARLFPPGMKTAWDQQIAWLKSPRSEQYRTEIRRSIDRLRTGNAE
jgi:hypothetical protein